MRLLRGWRPALRIARREALRARGRSILVLVMIGLPVLAIVALDTLGRTADVSTREGLDRQLAAADVRMNYQSGTGSIDQDPLLQSWGSDGAPLPAPTAETLRALLGPGCRVIELVDRVVTVRTAVGRSRPAAMEVDLRDPMTKGLVLLTGGRLPADPGEVVVSGRLAARGFPIGSTLTLDSGEARHVVGLVESASRTDATMVVGPPGALGLEPDPGFRSWLAVRPGGVDWQTVRALNQQGVSALSRAVVQHPPPASQVTTQDPHSGGMDGAELAVLALVVAMALLEVVLLAGPAFAVGARRQQRSLALLVASGGEPPHIRRVVLASGVVLGSVAATAGAVGGIGVAWLATPAVQRISTERLGPFEINPRDVVAIALCGLASAVLAALAPALLATRHDVVAVLAGRRGETRPTARSPLVGAVLLLLGVAGSVYGASKATGGELYIAASAIAAVCGTVLLIPLVVAQLGRVARLLPLPARFAVRDAARHRSRTAPAVAAVAATVAGVVALGIGATSDAAQTKALYTPSGPLGAAVIASYSGFDRNAPAWPALLAAVHRQLPGARVQEVVGVLQSQGGAGTTADALSVEAVHPPGAPSGAGGYSTTSYGSSYVVGARSFDALRLDLPAADIARAEETLALGGVVIFGHDSRAVATATLTRQQYRVDGGEATTVGTWPVPATVVAVPGVGQPVRAVLSEQALRTTGMTARTTALLVDGVTIGTSAQDRLSEAVTGIDADWSVHVERGFHDNSTAVILLLLGTAGGALVLGGTLTSTFLALSDARPDFATMGAVGAAPRTRRIVAAAYAGTIGLVGAVVGALVGFVPGIAVTFPLTGGAWAPEGSTDTNGVPLPEHFLDVPWLLIGGLVVVLPLVTAAVVGLTSRSRLPMVSRLS